MINIANLTTVSKRFATLQIDSDIERRYLCLRVTIYLLVLLKIQYDVTRQIL